MNKITKTAQDLVNKLEKIRHDPLYQAVWSSAFIHGIDYSRGPKYDKELEELKKALSHDRHG